MESLDKKTKKNHRAKWILLSIVAFLIALRLVLPYILVHFANKTLATMHGYYGHINDIDLSIYRGAYVINDFYIDKIDSASQSRTPFISSQTIDLSVEWKALFHGRFVGELEFVNPVMRFTKDKAEPEAIQKDTVDFRTVLNTFMPLKINRFEIHNGKIQYIDSTASPKVNIALTDAHILAQNLSSVLDTALLPATVEATAMVYKGHLNLNMKLNPLSEQATFDLNTEVKDINLPALNDFLKAYTNFDVHAGTFGLYTEIAAKEGKFVGYVKPIIKDLEVIGVEDNKDSFINKLYEELIGVAVFVLENPSKDQVATKVPIKGEYDKTTVKVWYAAIEVLRNAFIQALFPALDHEIDIHSLNQENKKDKTLFQKIFNKSDKDAADKK